MFETVKHPSGMMPDARSKCQYSVSTAEKTLDILESLASQESRVRLA